MKNDYSLLFDKIAHKNNIRVVGLYGPLLNEILNHLVYYYYNYRRNEGNVMEKPLYAQMSERLIQIINQELSVGDLLPSERKLTEQFDVSRTTVRLALRDLESKGYISTKHGKGSFVVDHHKMLVNLSDMYSFTEQMKSIGKIPNTTLLDFKIIEDDEKLSKVFKNNVHSFIKLVRLRSADDMPMLYEETYIPQEKFPNITPEALKHRSLYDIFKEDYNEIVKMAYEEFSAVIATDKEAENLQLEKQVPVLKIYRTTINLDNEVIEYTESKARPDQFSYRTVHYNYLS